MSNNYRILQIAQTKREAENAVKDIQSRHPNFKDMLIEKTSFGTYKVKASLDYFDRFGRFKKDKV